MSYIYSVYIRLKSTVYIYGVSLYTVKIDKNYHFIYIYMFVYIYDRFIYDSYIYDSVYIYTMAQFFTESQTVYIYDAAVG